MTYNEIRKIAIMKWRHNNKQIYNDYVKDQMKMYHSKNKEKVNVQRMIRYYADKVYQDPFLMEAKTFRYILL